MLTFCFAGNHRLCNRWRYRRRCLGHREYHHDHRERHCNGEWLEHALGGKLLTPGSVDHRPHIRYHLRHHLLQLLRRTHPSYGNPQI